ncbi:MAG: hypothetical protein JO359_08685, partial [Candidatus Eremiobacteraeota bacterium]|nr:hypothetical protein [Candidatus Eremiobacteraeota bacterium]
ALGEGWTPAHEVSYVRRATPPEEAAALLAGDDDGPLSAARLLEPLAMLWITFAYRQGFGREFAFGILRR